MVRSTLNCLVDEMCYTIKHFAGDKKKYINNLPQSDAVLVHSLLIIIDCHQEISQHSVQDAVALIGQRIPQERNPFFVFLFPIFTNRDLFH